MAYITFTEPRILLRVRAKGRLGNVACGPDGRIAFSFNSWRRGSFIGIKTRDATQDTGWNKASPLAKVECGPSGRPRDNEYNDLQFTPDGKHILYSLSESDGEFHTIWLVDVATGEQTRLTESNKHVQVMSPNLSPDGAQIVFERWEQGLTNLGQMTVTGQETTNLTHTPLKQTDNEDYVYRAGNNHPLYSPDGQHIAFLSTDYNEKIDNSRQVCVMRSDGSEVTRLTDFPGNCADPVWHPSGKQIAFTTHAELDEGIERSLWKYRTNIYLVNVDGSDLRRLEISNSFNHIGGFSPNGRYLVYMTSGDERFKEGGQNWDIRLLDIATGTIYIVTDNDHYNQNPIFSPDGKSILYVSESEDVSCLYETEISH